MSVLFSHEILSWYYKNRRTLPWRETRDPYRIWLSEIILQQTRVNQGLPYYEAFVEAFPTVMDLADASEERVLKLWQGLGYYSRARNLHATAKKIAYEMNGIFPKTYKGLLQLKGVGDYTASAIASICYDEAAPVVDGNVYRVLARYFGVHEPINSPKGVKYFKAMAHEVMDAKNIRDYNQGLMEFGAIQCAPKNPNCSQCPLQSGCVALAAQQVGTLPVKLKTVKIKKRYFNYMVPIIDGGEGPKTMLHKREGSGIWQNLFEFPLWETQEGVEVQEVMDHLQDKMGLRTLEEAVPFYDVPVVHKLSHQHITAQFWVCPVAEGSEDSLLVSDLERYPVPVLMANFLKTFKF